MQASKMKGHAYATRLTPGPALAQKSVPHLGLNGHIPGEMAFFKRNVLRISPMGDVILHEDFIVHFDPNIPATHVAICQSSYLATAHNSMPKPPT